MPELHSPEPKFMVVGPPRGGFTLLLSVLNILYRDKGIQKSEVQDTVNLLIPVAADYVDAVLKSYFQEHINPDDLFYSKEFKILTGGPKWIDDEDDSVICVRKYLGVKGKGDFTFIQYLPKFTMDFDDVIHSHNHPRRWTEDPYYTDYLKFASIRNPIDIIHSSVYSINALTSEYIQRCIDETDHDIRLELALNKLSNLEFVEGLVKYLKNYLDEFISVKDRFRYVMRWEDLINTPVKTIVEIGEGANITMTEDYAMRIWKEIEHRNLTRYHKHSFRKGIMDDWKNSITNSHLEVFRDHGFNDYLEEFGYPKIEFFDESSYTNVQKTIEEHIKKGEVYKYRGDKDLYVYAFNKTNFAATGQYRFKAYPRSGGVKIEKSMFSDEPLLLGFIDKTGAALSLISKFLLEAKEAILKTAGSNTTHGFASLIDRYRPLFAKEMSSDGMAAFDAAFRSIDELDTVAKTPILVESYRLYNVVRYNRKYYAVPQNLGPVDFQQTGPAMVPEVITGDSPVTIKTTIDKLSLP